MQNQFYLSFFDSPIASGVPLLMRNSPTKINEAPIHQPIGSDSPNMSSPNKALCEQRCEETYCKEIVQGCVYHCSTQGSGKIHRFYKKIPHQCIADENHTKASDARNKFNLYVSKIICKYLIRKFRRNWIKFVQKMWYEFHIHSKFSKY